jgi:MFS family permease
MTNMSGSESADAPSKNPILRVLSLRDFRLLFGGTATSILGDQFYLIATPWLVLQLTRDPLAVGIVIALGGIPRAILMLVGGAAVDRFSPRAILIAADVVRLLLTGLLALAVVTGSIQMWMLFAVSIGFGTVAGFAIPASNSMVPRLVPDRDLQAGNSVILGSAQIAGFIGPTLAGLLIGGLAKSLTGVAWAYAIDSVSFGASAAALLLMRPDGVRPAGTGGAKPDGIWDSIAAGLKFVWNDEPMRLLFLILVAVNFLFIGPLLVGIPVLADLYLAGGAVAYGLLVSGLAGGNLAGFLLASQLPRPDGKTVQVILVAALAAFGIAIGSLGFLRSTGFLLVVMVLLGLGNGYVTILALTWIQARTPRAILGRMMSLLMLTNTGLSPVSQAVAGAVSRLSLLALFFGSGIGLVIVPIWVARQPALKAFGDSFSAQRGNPPPPP